MSVPEQIPTVSYTANGTTTNFPITFELSDERYLVVTKNMEIPPVGAYTVSNGDVVFGVAPNEGDIITLMRDTVLDRETNYQNYDNSFRPEAINYDLDKIWHVLQEQNLIDAKLLSRVKEEIEWRRTHDANFDELALMRDSQVFTGLKQYVDTYIAATNPNIFGGVTAGIVFALDKKSVQTHLDILYQELVDARRYIDEEESRATNAETLLQQSITNETDRAIGVESDLQTQINVLGVGNKAYLTYAAMDADKANIQAKSKVTVTNDPLASNNGDWQWDGVTFTKSTYDPINQSKNYTDLEILNKVLNFFRPSTESNNIFNVFDLNENSVLRVDKNGDIYIYGHSDALQKILKDLEKKTSSIIPADNLTDLHLLADKNDIPVFRIAQNGDFFIFGYSESLQSILAKVQNDSALDETKAVTVFNKKILYVREYLDMFTQLLTSQLSTAAIPHFSSKQQFNLGSAWIDSIKMDLSSQRIVIAGYDPTLRDDIGVVHPQIWSFDKEVGGYKFWLGLNPYTNTNEDIELPFIYGSNDPELKTWELIPSFPIPFDVDPPNIGGVTSGHGSDSGFVYDIKSGDLLFFWRITRYRGNRDITTATNEFKASRFDGKKWSENFTIVDESLIIGDVTDYLLSPNIVYNPADNLYHMFTINNDGKMYRRTTNDLNSRQWSSRTECVFDDTNFTPWHLDMKFVGSKLVALIHIDTAGANEYRFAVSDDFLNFTVSSTTIVNNPNPSLYKATFLPLLNQNDFKMRIIYTTDQDTVPNWQLHVADTTSVSY